MLVIVNIMFCNAAVCTSCYVPVEGQYAVNIQRAIFGVCALVVQLSIGKRFWKSSKNFHKF